MGLLSHGSVSSAVAGTVETTVPIQQCCVSSLLLSFTPLLLKVTAVCQAPQHNVAVLTQVGWNPLWPVCVSVLPSLTDRADGPAASLVLRIRLGLVAVVERSLSARISGIGCSCKLFATS